MFIYEYIYIHVYIYIGQRARHDPPKKHISPLVLLPRAAAALVHAFLYGDQIPERGKEFP